MSGEPDGTKRIRPDITITIAHDGLDDFATAVVTSWTQISECAMTLISSDGENQFAITRKYFYLNYTDNDRGTGYNGVVVGNRVCVTIADGVLTWDSSHISSYLPTGWDSDDVCRINSGTPKIEVFNYDDGDMTGVGTPHTTITLTGHSFSGETVNGITTSTTHIYVMVDGDTIYGFKVSDGSLEYTIDFAPADGLMIAYNATSDELIVFDKTTNTLYELHPATGAVNSSALASAVPDTALGMDFDQDNGMLYYADSENVYSLTRAEGGILNVDDADTQVILAVLQTLQTTPSAGGQGKQDSITTSAIQLTATPTACRYVRVQAHKDNTDKIYVGFVGIAVTEGVCLDPMDSVGFWIDDLDVLYAIADSGTQGVGWVFVV